MQNSIPGNPKKRECIANLAIIYKIGIESQDRIIFTKK